MADLGTFYMKNQNKTVVKDLENRVDTLLTHVQYLENLTWEQLSPAMTFPVDWREHPKLTTLEKQGIWAHGFQTCRQQISDTLDTKIIHLSNPVIPTNNGTTNPLEVSELLMSEYSDVVSEACRIFKIRPELFRAALKHIVEEDKNAGK